MRFNKTSKMIPVVLLFALLGASLFVTACGQSEPEVQTETGEKQLWTCGMHPEVIQEEPGNCPICGMQLVPLRQEPSEATPTIQVEQTRTTTSGVQEEARESTKKGRKILYWRAPMDPTYISDKPGKSPMGMDLIPVYEGEDDLAAGPTITIDPVTMQNIGVKTAPVERIDLYREIRTVGHLDYNEDRIFRVNVKFSGWVENLFVSETGQPVKRGQPLLEIYSPELVSTQEEYLLALVNHRRLSESPISTIANGANALLESARRRLLYWDITEEQIRRLETEGVIQKAMRIYSPVDGIVIKKHVEEGMRVGPGMDLYRVADLSTIWVYGHVFEYEVPWLRVGETVEVELPYIPGKIFEGRVQYIYPFLDPKTRDVKIRIELPNPGLHLKPEMYANLRIRSRIGEKVVAVPDEAVIRSGKRNVVFVALGGGKFEPRDVVLGAEGEDGYIQVVSGLEPGEEVVISAQFLLDSESRLKEAIQKMLEVRKGKQAMPEMEGEPEDEHKEMQHD